jgi:23S rRNA pseudouridine2605 synthase
LPRWWRRRAVTEAAPERIAKRLARAGLCSRREAERWIAAGRVAVDGRRLDTPALNVTASSLITVDGAPIPEAQAASLWRYHKPRGLITTHNDPQGRTTIFERLPARLGRVVSAGRLDLNSEGLLLLTNDGGLARRFGRSKWRRRYRVRVHGTVDPERLARLARGATVEGVRYAPFEAAIESKRGTNTWLTLSLREGKNREARRIMEALGGQVTRLIRTAFGPFQLGALASGKIAKVPAKVLAEQLGKDGLG